MLRCLSSGSRRFLALCGAMGVLGAGSSCTIPPAPDIVYTYEVVGTDNTTDLEEFALLAGETLNDPAGWALGGTIAYQRVAGGGDFALWLASPAQVATFAPVCSTEWSCSVGRNVVINEDRWLNASAAWTASGASLRDYRHMVVNHETGHWLGFGHARCPGAGETAPVMQQQSIDLHGCHPNSWPLPFEREAVAAARNIGVR